jgi:hypothetical protein
LVLIRALQLVLLPPLMQQWFRGAIDTGRIFVQQSLRMYIRYEFIFHMYIGNETLSTSFSLRSRPLYSWWMEKDDPLL